MSAGLLHWYKRQMQWTRLQSDHLWTSGNPWPLSELSLTVWMRVINRSLWRINITYLRWISSGRGLLFHSIALSSHCFTSSSLRSSKTLDRAARYFPMSFSPPSESAFCSMDTRSAKIWPQADLAVHALADVGWPRVSDLDLPGLSSFAFPDA